MDDVTICNLALTRIGDETITALSDTSKRARLCRVHYAPTRRAVLEAHPWNFAVKRAELAVLADAPNHEFTYALTLPTDFLRVIRTSLEAEGYDDAPYRIETMVTGGDVVRVLVTDTDTLSIEYLADVTDPNLFSPLFVDLLAARLAAELCMPITDTMSAAQALWQIYESKLREARSTDAQQGTPREFFGDQWIAARL